MVEKGKIGIRNIHAWENEILTDIELVDPTLSEMIDSTFLPDYHKDPFDHLSLREPQSNTVTGYPFRQDRILNGNIDYHC